jgi:hypothetical protein
MRLNSTFKKKCKKFFYELISLNCRVYARMSMPGDEPADWIMTFLISLAFRLVHGYKPDFKRPHSFSEKLFDRMLYSRDPKWTYITDKLKVREFVSERIGVDYLIPLLWSGKRPEDIPFEKLPEKFFIKTNHGCEYNILVKDRNKLSIRQLQSQLNTWLKENFCTDYFLGTQWAYKNIDPQIIIETFINDNGKSPDDYKFYCFSGRVEYLLMIGDRFGPIKKQFFTRDLKPIDIRRDSGKLEDDYQFPKNYKEMIRVAEALSAGFDFIRVDLYNVKGKIYFGELTCYPAGGLAPFIPREWDFIFGEKWKFKKIAN